MFMLMLITRPHRPIFSNDRDAKVIIFNVVPRMVPYMAHLALPIPCRVVVRGDWM